MSDVFDSPGGIPDAQPDDEKKHDKPPEEGEEEEADLDEMLESDELEDDDVFGLDEPDVRTDPWYY